MDRLQALPGFGEQKAKIFAALLGKQLGVRPEGWREATTPYGERGTSLSVADITDPESLEKVRATKKAMKAKARAEGVTRPRPRRPPPLSLHAGPARSGRRSSPPASLVASTSSSCATRSSTPGHSWPGRPVAATCAGPRRALRAQRPARPRARSGADGVHVGQDDAPVSLARRILGPDAIVGLSTHSPSRPRRRGRRGVTYISAGPVEATPTKPGRPGRDRLRHSGQRTVQRSRLRDGRRDTGENPSIWSRRASAISSWCAT